MEHKLEESRRSVGETRELTRVADTHVDVLVVVLHLLGGALFGSANVDLVALEATELLVNPGKYPGSRADTTGFEGKGNAKQNVGQRVRKEGEGESRSDELPGDGSENGGDDGTKKTGVEKILDGVGHAKDVVALSGYGGNGGNTCNNKHARDNCKLTSNHKAGEVAAFTLEEELAGGKSALGISAFFLLELGDGEESNLHTLFVVYNHEEKVRLEDAFIKQKGRESTQTRTVAGLPQAYQRLKEVR